MGHRSREASRKEAFAALTRLQGDSNGKHFGFRREYATRLSEQKLVSFAAKKAREHGADVKLIDLREYSMPVYDGDMEDEQGAPDSATRLFQLMKQHKGLLLSRPEYNSSITAVLKNTIDWVSRLRQGEQPLSAFTGKVAGLMSASPGGFGGMRGLVHVRSILSNIGVLVLPNQVAVPRAHEAFDVSGFRYSWASSHQENFIKSCR